MCSSPEVVLGNWGHFLFIFRAGLGKRGGRLWGRLRFFPFQKLPWIFVFTTRPNEMEFPRGTGVAQETLKAQQCSTHVGCIFMRKGGELFYSYYPFSPFFSFFSFFYFAFVLSFPPSFNILYILFQSIFFKLDIHGRKGCIHFKDTVGFYFYFFIF